jgi:hypothetical protein
VTRSGLGRLWRLAVFDSTFVAQIATFLRFALAFERLAVFVHLLLDETSTFFDFTLTLMSVSFSAFATVSDKTNAPEANLLHLEWQF